MQAYWEQVFLWALEAEQSEDMALEIGGFGECDESGCGLSLADAAGVSAARGEVVHQGL